MLAGWMLSSLFLVLAVVMLTRLSQEFHWDIDPTLPAAFLLAYPTAFFLNAVYSESLFLFLSLATVFWALRRNFMIASVWAALASATRVAGVFLFVVLFIEFVQANGWRALLTRRVWPLALAPLGALAFCTYHWIAFGDFFSISRCRASSAETSIWKPAIFWFATTPIWPTPYLTSLHCRGDPVGDHRAEAVQALLRRVHAGLARHRLEQRIGPGDCPVQHGVYPIYFIAAGIRSPVGPALCSGLTLLLALDIIRLLNHYWTS